MSGTPMLDIIVPGVGRIHRHVGSEDPRVVKGVPAVVYLCVEQGRLDVIERLRDGTITPLQLYDAYRTNRLARLATAGTLVRLLPKLVEFEKVYPQSEGYRKDIRLARRQIEAVARASSTLGDLPKLLLHLKSRYERLGAAVTFNRHKRVLLSFCTWARVQRESPLWDEVRRVPGMKYQRPQKPGLTVEEFRAGVAKLPLEHARIAWSLVLTGMNWKEYRYDGWEADPEAGVVRIHGEKRAARDRVIPYLGPLYGPARDYRRFRIMVHRAFGSAVTPHTFRRTFTQWAQKAGVPRFQAKALLGHAGSHEDVHALYEDETVTAQALKDIRKKMLAYIGRPLGAVVLTLEQAA